MIRVLMVPSNLLKDAEMGEDTEGLPLFREKAQRRQTGRGQGPL